MLAATLSGLPIAADCNSVRQYASMHNIYLQQGRVLIIDAFNSIGNFLLQFDLTVRFCAKNNIALIIRTDNFPVMDAIWEPFSFDYRFNETVSGIINNCTVRAQSPYRRAMLYLRQNKNVNVSASYAFDQRDDITPFQCFMDLTFRVSRFAEYYKNRIISSELKMKAPIHS